MKQARLRWACFPFHNRRGLGPSTSRDDQFCLAHRARLCFLWGAMNYYLCRVAYAAVVLWSAVVLCPNEAGAQAALRISFDAQGLGQFPAGWVTRDSKARELYSVQAEGGRRFLHAETKGVSAQIGYEAKWPLGDYPVLRWQWRPIVFPSNTDERKKEGGDSVLGIYVVFGSWPFIKSLKYVWSDTLPLGTCCDSPFSKSTKIIVVRSGRLGAGTWVTEVRDVLADYRRFFGDGDRNPVAEGIAILTDSDNTNSQAIGDYGDIEILPGPDRAAPAKDGKPGSLRPS